MLAHRAQGITGPGKFQEQPKSTQEWPGKAPGWIWASWPTWLRAARSSPGSSRSSPRAPRSGQENLLVGFGHPVPWQAHRGAGSQEQPRKLQEQPQSTQEWPGGPPGRIWASCTLAGPPGHSGSWGGGRAARSSPGSSRSSPRAPRHGQEELLADFGHPRLSRPRDHRHQGKGSGRRVISV